MLGMKETLERLLAGTGCVIKPLNRSINSRVVFSPGLQVSGASERRSWKCLGHMDIDMDFHEQMGWRIELMAVHKFKK